MYAELAQILLPMSVFGIFLVLLLYAVHRRDWMYKILLAETTLKHTETTADRLREIQQFFLSNAQLEVSKELMNEEEWGQVILIMEFSDLPNPVDRESLEGAVEKWAYRLSQQQPEVRFKKCFWIWGNVKGYPKAVCILHRVGDVSKFFPYLAQLSSDLSMLDPKKSELTHMALKKPAECSDLLANILVDKVVSQ